MKRKGLLDSCQDPGFIYMSLWLKVSWVCTDCHCHRTSGRCVHDFMKEINGENVTQVTEDLLHCQYFTQSSLGKQNPSVADFDLLFFFSGLSCLMIIKEGQGQVSILKDFSFFFFESPLWGEKGLPWHPFFLPLTCLSPCINLPNFWGVSPWMKSWLLLCACVCLLCLGGYKAHGDKGFFLFTSSMIHLPWVRPQPHKLRVQSPQIVPPPPPHCFRHQLQVWGPQGTLTSDLLATKFGSSFCILRFENSMNDSQNSEKCHTPYYSVFFFFLIVKG